MEPATSRRRFLRTGAFAVTAAALPISGWSVEEHTHAKPGAIRLGVASYSLRKFDRAQVIEAMKQLNTPFLNAKDVKDHLPMTPPEADAAGGSGIQGCGDSVDRGRRYLFSENG